MVAVCCVCCLMFSGWDLEWSYIYKVVNVAVYLMSLIKWAD